MAYRIFFLVQGEGRGHMTQAIALRQLLMAQGMEVCAVVVGSNKRRDVPAFFTEKFEGTPVALLPSPNFVTRHNRGINLAGTAWQSITHLRSYRRSVRLLDTLIKTHKPDLIINFYEPLTALWKMLRRSSIPVVAIAHQYLMEHDRFKHPRGHFFDRLILKYYTRFTAFGAARHLGLSFYPLADRVSTRLRVVPPLLRAEVAALHPHKAGHFLVYMVNAGYLTDVMRWHTTHPDVLLHVFTDRKQEAETEEVQTNLFVHRLNDVKFLQLMATANGLISTAGFESVCEALYLDKPVYMIPVEHHFEQFCNSRDAYRAGAGIYSSTYDLDRYLQWLPRHISRSLEFREWADKAGPLISAHLREVLAQHAPQAVPPSSGIAVAH
jgi:uncharacterized protein (TIGR00661 family)